MTNNADQSPEQDTITALTKQKELIEAQKALIEAAIPQSSIQPLTGDITTDSTTFGKLTTLAAYLAMKKNVDSIGAAINQLPLTKSDHILIVDERNFAHGDLALLQLQQQFDVFKKQFEDQIPKNKKILEKSKGLRAPPRFVAQAIPMVPLIISSIADIASYFKVNYTVTSMEITVTHDAIIPLVARAITSPKVYILDFNIIQKSEILTLLTALLHQNQELERLRVQVASPVVDSLTLEIQARTDQITQLETELQALEKEAELEKIRIEAAITQQKTMLNEKNSLLTEVKLAAAASLTLKDAFTTFLTTITQASDDQSLPLLAQAALRKHLQAQTITHLLYIKALYHGGAAITKKSLWRSGQIAYIGGSIVCFILATSKGEIMAADTLIAAKQLDYNLSAPGSTRSTDVRL